eukprot:gene2903-3957_t
MIAFGLPPDAEFDMGGHGLMGSLPHYLRFTRAILNGGILDGNRILASTTVELMSQNHIGELSVPVMKTNMPTLSNDCDLHPGIDLKWGLSFIINQQQLPEGRAAGGGGGLVQRRRRRGRDMHARIMPAGAQRAGQGKDRDRPFFPYKTKR